MSVDLVLIMSTNSVLCQLSLEIMDSCQKKVDMLISR